VGVGVVLRYLFVGVGLWVFSWLVRGVFVCGGWGLVGFLGGSIRTLRNSILVLPCSCIGFSVLVNVHSRVSLLLGVCCCVRRGGSVYI